MGKQDHSEQGEPREVTVDARSTVTVRALETFTAGIADSVGRAPECAIMRLAGDVLGRRGMGTGLRGGQSCRSDRSAGRRVSDMYCRRLARDQQGGRA